MRGPSLPDIEGKPRGYAIDYPGNPDAPGCGYERDFLRFNQGAGPVVYAHVGRDLPDEDHPPEDLARGIAIQYWAFHYFNDWNNTHEGDWEMVQVTWDVDTVEEALTTAPVIAAYSQHGGGERHDWDGDVLELEDGHPVVYISAGSHASFFKPRTYLGLGESGSGFGCDVAAGPHHRLAPEAILVPSDPTEWTGEFAWLSFQGRFGQPAGGEFNGPTGPPSKDKWDRPISWAENLRDGSTTIPGETVFGLNAVHSFCGVVEWLSDRLRDFFRFPVFVGGAAFGLLGLLVLSVAMVVRGLLKDPLVGPGEGGFLDHRRSLGQMVRASTVIFWRHPLLFLGLSVVFVPIDAAMSVAIAYLYDVPPFSELIWLFDANRVSRMTVALLVGGVASLAVYVFVGSGAIAAVRGLDAGERVTIRGAYEAAFRRAGHTLGARAWTLFVLAVLGLSIIGIPIAVWLAVRWGFIEQAVMLDGETHRTAPGTSARAVRGRWFGALAAVIAFGAWAAIAGPLLGFALLLGTAVPPSTVNLIAGLVHAVTLPYTAIGLCLAYRDLQLHSAEDEAHDAAGEDIPPGRVRSRAYRLWTGPVRWERALEQRLRRRPASNAVSPGAATGRRARSASASAPPR